MLTAHQLREVTRFKKLRVYLNSKTGVIETYPPFQDEVGDFMDNLEQLEVFVPDKNNTGTGITDDKTVLKHEIADKLAPICTTTKAYALKYNKGELAAEMNFRATEIFRIADNDLKAFVEHIQTLLTPILEDENYVRYGVTATAITELVTKANTFDAYLGKAGVKTSGNTVANENINVWIKKLHGNITQFDLLIDYFHDKNDDFVLGYHINSAIDRAGIRHSGIEGFVRLNGEPVAGVTITIAKLHKSATSDLYGHYELTHATPGDYTIEAEGPGFPKKTVIQHISRGKISTLDFGNAPELVVE